MDYSTFTLWTNPFPIKGMPGKFLLVPCYKEIPVFDANSVDPDQTPHSPPSDLGLHCLPVSHLLEARHKGVKEMTF